MAEAANLSDRTYADIERGTVNIRIETILKICDTLHITPDVVLTEENPCLAAKQEEIISELEKVHSTSERIRTESSGSIPGFIKITAPAEAKAVVLNYITFFQKSADCEKTVIYTPF